MGLPKRMEFIVEPLWNNINFYDNANSNLGGA